MSESVSVPAPALRVVSLVPSLTEAVAATAPGLLVGVTDWCTRPADLTAARIGGTKNPDVAAIVALRPDLVVANEEENRAPDLDALRDAGIEVLTTEIRSLDQAFAELHRVLVTGCGLARPRWLDEAEAAWAALRRRTSRAARSCRSGAGPGWCSAVTRSRAICWPGSVCGTCTQVTSSATRASRSTN